MSSFQDFQNFVEEKGVHITGLQNMPEIGITKVLFENPWATEDEDDLFPAKGMHLTLARMPNGRVHPLNKVSSDYRLVQHHEAIYKALEAIITNHPEFGIPEVVATFHKNGGIMNAKFIFPEVVKLDENDPIKPQVVLTNSADLSKRFTLLFGAFRLICSNGLVVPDTRFPDHVKMKKLHKMGTLNLGDAIDAMMRGFENFSSTLEVWKEYNGKSIGREDWEAVMREVDFSDNQVKEISELTVTGWGKSVQSQLLLDIPIPAWQAYNAATEWITHQTKNENTAMDRGAAVSAAFERVLAI